MEKHLDSMVMVARIASRNVRIVRIYLLTVLFTFTMVIIISERAKRASSVMFVFNRDFRYVYIYIYVAVRQPLRACPDIIAKKRP